MQWKAVGVCCALIAFAGCGASPDASDQGEPVENVRSSVTACASYTATLQDHVSAGRAERFDTQFLFWTFTTYATTGENPEQIGNSATQVVTLYAKPNGYTLNSALCQKATCGNGVLEAPTEQCDGGQFYDGTSNPTGALNCNAFGADPPWATGYDVGCTADCKYDFSTCKRVACGDGNIDGNEQCDGQNLGSITTCQQYTDGGVFTGGTLKCSPSCTFDTSGCTSLCGNGVLDAGEDCDGTLYTSQYAGKTCASFQVQYPTWPFGVRVPYLDGRLSCDKFCKVNLPAICKPPTGCYYTPIAGSQPAIGVRCF